MIPHSFLLPHYTLQFTANRFLWKPSVQGCLHWIIFYSNSSLWLLSCTHPHNPKGKGQVCFSVFILLTPSAHWWLRGKEYACQYRTRVQSLIREDPTCCRAPKPLCHNHQACALDSGSHNCIEPVCCNCRSLHALEPLLHRQRSHHDEKPTHHN